MANSDDLLTQQLNSSTTDKQSILVIDDNAEALTLQKTLLSIEGYNVFTAQSGDEAFDILSKIDEPDLILLDVLMGDLSGPDFLAALEKKRPDIVADVPVVFLTGMDEVPLSKAAGFIRKATKIETFLQAVHQYIELGSHSHKKKLN